MTHPSPGQLCPVLGHRLGIDARATYGVTGPPPATALGGPSSRRYGAGIADPDTAAAAGRVSQAGRPSRSARTSWRAGVWRFRPVPPPRVARVSRVAAVGGCRPVLGSRRASADDGRCRPACRTHRGARSAARSRSGAGPGPGIVAEPRVGQRPAHAAAGIGGWLGCGRATSLAAALWRSPEAV